MAGADKNSRRSDAGRNPTQPAQPVSQAESGAVDAGEIPSALTDASARRGVSHEAKLGMMVITILVAAFCFLVYHKMDMRQRQLTQAAIKSPEAAATGLEAGLSGANGTAFDGSGDANNSATIVGQRPVRNVDPLIDSNNLSDGSPFALSEPQPDSDSFITTAPNETANISFEPGDSVAGTVEESANVQSETTMQFDALADSRDATQSAELRFDENSSGSTSDRQSFDGTSLSSGFNQSEIPANSDDRSLIAARDHEPEPSSSAMMMQIESEPAIYDNFDQSSDSDQTSPTLDTLSATPESANADAREFDDTDRSTSRPDTLLAMADSGTLSDTSEFADDETPTFDAYAADETNVNSRPSTAVHDITERGPDESNSASGETLLAMQDQTQFGSGFDSVTQPSGRQNGRRNVRTAAGSGAGSGADGKFSLAAFNYQNNTAEPAPDDGSQFDSVIVKDGDNYTKISKRIYGAGRYFSALAVFNQHRIPDPAKMRPGMVVLTPPRELLEERYPQLFEGSKPKETEPAGFLLLDDGTPACRVGDRETLSDISERYLGRSARWIEIYRLNQQLVDDPNKLKPGSVLVLPDDATEVNVAP